MYQPLPNDCNTERFAASMKAFHSRNAASASALLHVASGAVRFASSLRRAMCAMITCGYWPKRAKYLACMARTRATVLRSVVVVADPPQRSARSVRDRRGEKRTAVRRREYDRRVPGDVFHIVVRAEIRTAGDVRYSGARLAGASRTHRAGARTGRDEDDSKTPDDAAWPGHE